MMLVTGATGTVGAEVARLLAPRFPVRLMSRRPESAGVPQAEHVRADYEDAASVARAMAGVRAVFLVTANPLREHDTTVLEAARAAGVRRVVKLSAAAVTDPLAVDLVTSWQRRAERAVRSGGMEWTLLRPRAFMSNTLSWARSVAEEDTVRVPHPHSRNACVDPRDVAGAAVRVLTEPGHGQRAYVLTGPEALSAAEQTEVLARVLGRELRCERQDAADAVAALNRRYPAPVAEALWESARRQREGAKQDVDPALARLLGRPCGDYRSWALDHAEAFKKS
ncbi:NAD(P)H-binding protein [Streptomyces sp. NPDC008150]|uniref:NAD(P)H-binding protein n=1 Tax=Streptomyces sp. NPDC008150 TaxID=3364816 RepID=UPI0036ED32C8